ncbi:hypothetical protein SAMN04488115_107147 [Bosea lathyri]|uniref:Uncharacterized protein n=1 Tax=Bosea lathyri TaxID=1036778 RepID=A0A1H6BER6_9HYPH|nr:hypothetical protein SAMN04488115_107147 [Bosea lathyri]
MVLRVCVRPVSSIIASSTGALLYVQRRRSLPGPAPFALSLIDDRGRPVLEFFRSRGRSARSPTILRGNTPSSWATEGRPGIHHRALLLTMDPGAARLRRLSGMTACFQIKSACLDAEKPAEAGLSGRSRQDRSAPGGIHHYGRLTVCGWIWVTCTSRPSNRAVQSMVGARSAISRNRAVQASQTIAVQISITSSRLPILFRYRTRPLAGTIVGQFSRSLSHCFCCCSAFFLRGREMVPETVGHPGPHFLCPPCAKSALPPSGRGRIFRVGAPSALAVPDILS